MNHHLSHLRLNQLEVYPVLEYPRDPNNKLRGPRVDQESNQKLAVEPFPSTVLMNLMARGRRFISVFQVHGLLFGGTIAHKFEL